MPAYKTPEQFAKQAGGFAGQLQKAQRASMGKVGLHVKTVTLASLRVTVGPELRMSGIGKKGAKVGVSYDVKGYKNPSVLVRALGPVHLVERSTKPHRIPKQNRRKKKYAVVPGVGVREHANHPGTHGKRPWGRGVDAALPAVPRIIQAGVHQALKDTFSL